MLSGITVDDERSTTEIATGSPPAALYFRFTICDLIVVGMFFSEIKGSQFSDARIA